ncbi:hypothetical protein QR77_39440 [Streptomyces sp. 150FB]|nr:hypothetical protein QR77_39440 [Streptomyces sp. 150FB]
MARLELPGSLLEPGEPKREVFVAAGADTRVVHCFLEDPELACAPDAWTAHATAVEGGYRVDVHASSFTRDLALLADRLAPDAETDEMLVTLLAGDPLVPGPHHGVRVGAEPRPGCHGAGGHRRGHTAGSA